MNIISIIVSVSIAGLLLCILMLNAPTCPDGYVAALSGPKYLFACVKGYYP
jgi:hypothetical protein